MSLSQSEIFIVNSSRIYAGVKSFWIIRLVRARTPACSLIGIRIVGMEIQLQTWMRVIVDVDV
jgi:hypothetical protein